MINSFRGKYGFLSNFYERPVFYDGITYQNNEAAFQAQKTLDIEERKQFADLSPSVAKRKGRKVTLRNDWGEVKFDVMLEICRAKFTQNQDLAETKRLAGKSPLRRTAPPEPQARSIDGRDSRTLTTADNARLHRRHQRRRHHHLHAEPGRNARTESVAVVRRLHERVPAGQGAYPTRP